MTKTLSKRTKLMYGVGDLGFSITSTIIATYFAIFLTDVVGISPGIVAIAIFIGRSWDYINDPLIGYISDRTRSKWGRRRPFLLFGALPFGIVFVLLWWKPSWTNEVALAVYYAAAYVLFDTAATFAYMPYFALTPELTSDYDERTSLTTYRMFFSIVGSLVAFTLPLVIIGAFVPESAPRILTMGIIFGVISMLPLLLAFAGTREQPEYMELKTPTLRQSIQSAAKNRPFLFGIGIFLLTWVSIDILQTTLLYFIKYVIHRQDQSDIFMALIFITAICALPLWSWISRRWSKRHAYMGGIAFWAVVQLILITLSASTGTSLIIFICILAGIGVGAAHVLPWAILPDAVEWDEWQTGERHEGIFYSLVVLIQKVASSIAIPLILLILEFTGYVPNAAQQPANALLGIRLVIGPIPAILLLTGIFLAFRYPLTRERYEQICRELEIRRKAKTQETL